MSWSFKIIFYYVLGTFMEFGIMPIVESYGILLSLNAFGIINLEDTPYNNALLNGAQRCRLKINNIVMLLFFLSFLWKKNTNKLTNFVFVFFFTVLAMLLTVVMSVLFIMTGMYGELENIGVAILIGIQVYYVIYYIEIIKFWLQIDNFYMFYLL